MYIKVLVRIKRTVSYSREVNLQTATLLDEKQKKKDKVGESERNFVK